MNADAHRYNLETYYLYMLLKAKHSKDLSFALKTLRSKTSLICDHLCSSVGKFVYS